MSTNPPRQVRSQLVPAVLFHVSAAAVAVVFLLPLVWVLAASLRQPGLPPSRTIEWLPDPLTWSNYVRIFQLVPLGRYTLNSLFVVAVAVPLTLITASWAGFAMAQLPPQIRRRLVVFAVLLLMLPVTTIWLTRFVVLRFLGLIDTYWALFIPALMGSSPLFVLLFYWTFRRIPDELWEAAHLDGAGLLHIWIWIAVPLGRPAMVTVGMLAFVHYWSDFLNPLMYLKSERRYTLPVGLQTLQQLDRTNWSLLMAGAVVLTGPVVLVFLLAQRYFWAEGGRYGFKR